MRGFLLGVVLRQHVYEAHEVHLPLRRAWKTHTRVPRLTYNPLHQSEPSGSTTYNQHFLGFPLDLVFLPNVLK